MGGFIDIADTLPSINSYEQALAFWQHSKPWRAGASLYYDLWDRANKTTVYMTKWFESHGGTENVRPLGHRRKFHRNVRMQGMDVVFRLYETDIVTWHADNSLTIVPYQSKLTGEIVGCLTPQGVGNNFGDSKLDGVFHLADGYHRAQPGGVHLTQQSRDAGAGTYVSWWVADPETTMPFAKRIIDRGAARKALNATSYREFAHWLRATRALGVQQDGRLFDHRYSSYPWLMKFEDRDCWMEFASCNLATDRMLDTIRQKIYAGKCYKTVEVMVIEDYRELESYRRNADD